MTSLRLGFAALFAATLPLACAASGGGLGPYPTGDTGPRVDRLPYDVPPLDTGSPTPSDVPPSTDTAAQPPTDTGSPDVSSTYDVSPAADAPACDAGPACSPRADNCGARETCGNGLDDNCNGTVDEACPCIPGSVQRCFLGPPGRRSVGACTDGNQTCQGTGEFGTWGPCMGGISPSGEACDRLDNDCNGCEDDGLCCTAPGSCPGPGDPRIPTGTPFRPITLRGGDFGPGATRYQWHVVGGPCDQMLFDTSSRVSYGLNRVPGTTGGSTLDAEGETLTLNTTLSGDYTVTLVITFPGGRTLRCNFIVPVRAPGFRTELCWNTTGRDDVDLWVHDPRNTRAFPVPTFAPRSADTCAYDNCRNARTIDWGYGAGTSGGACREPVGGATGVCNNPRLDVDNIDTAGIPENINVDRPRPGDRFRVAVNYYGGTARPSPMVNIYCGGQLRATFGGYDTRGGVHLGAAPVTGFTTSGDDTTGTFWRVADAIMNNSDMCTIRAIHPRGSTSGYCVNTSTDRTWDGPCAAATP